MYGIDGKYYKNGLKKQILNEVMSSICILFEYFGESDGTTVTFDIENELHINGVDDAYNNYYPLTYGDGEVICPKKVMVSFVNGHKEVTFVDGLTDKVVPQEVMEQLSIDDLLNFTDWVDGLVRDFDYIKEHKDSYEPTNFFKRFNANDAKEIWGA